MQKGAAAHSVQQPPAKPFGKRLLLEDFLGVAGDHQLLVGSNDQSAHLCAPGSNLAHIAHGVLVLLGIDADAQPIHVVADLCTGNCIVLADAAGEDDGIHAAHCSDVSANGLLDLVVQHVGSQLCALVAGSSCLFHVTLVAGNTGDAQQAGLLVQDLVQLVAGDVQGVLQVVDHRGVQVAAAGAHHQAGQRGHAHRGINDLALIDSGDGGTIAQMAGDQLQALNRLLKELGSAVADILVAGAVEAVAADAVLLIVLIGDGVHISLRGHGGVESRVKGPQHSACPRQRPCRRPRCPEWRQGCAEEPAGSGRGSP